MKKNAYLKRQISIWTWIQALKERDDNAWLTLMEMFRHNRTHILGSTYAHYGRPELQAIGLDEEEINAEMNAALWEAVQRYVPDKKTRDNANEYKNFRSYLTLYARCAVRRAIERHNQCSRHYSDGLLRLKVKKLDLWHSPEEDVIAALAEIAWIRKRDDPHAQATSFLGTLREYFADDRFRTVPIEEVPDSAHDGAIGHADFRLCLDTIYELIGNERHVQIFQEYFLEERKNISELAREHEVSALKIRTIIDNTRKIAQHVFSEQLPAAKLPGQDHSFASAHDGLDAEDYLEGLFE